MARTGRKSASKPTLLSGGNPQIAKGDGEAPVREYMHALVGWRRDAAERIDALISETVPEVSKAVRWNSPMYGIKGQGWFVSLHVFNTFIKVTFFKGTSLRPTPTGGTAQEARWINVTEDSLNEQQLRRWFRQAATLPGWGNF